MLHRNKGSIQKHGWYFFLLSFTEKKVNKEAAQKANRMDFYVPRALPAMPTDHPVRTFLGFAAHLLKNLFSVLNSNNMIYLLW